MRSPNLKTLDFIIMTTLDKISKQADKTQIRSRIGSKVQNLTVDYFDALSRLHVSIDSVLAGYLEPVINDCYEMRLSDLMDCDPIDNDAIARLQNRAESLTKIGRVYSVSTLLNFLFLDSRYGGWENLFFQNRDLFLTPKVLISRLVFDLSANESRESKHLLTCLSWSHIDVFSTVKYKGKTYQINKTGSVVGTRTDYIKRFEAKDQNRFSFRSRLSTPPIEAIATDEILTHRQDPRIVWEMQSRSVTIQIWRSHNRGKHICVIKAIARDSGLMMDIGVIRNLKGQCFFASKALSKKSKKIEKIVRSHAGNAKKHSLDLSQVKRELETVTQQIQALRHKHRNKGISQLSANESLEYLSGLLKKQSELKQRFNELKPVDLNLDHKLETIDPRYLSDVLASLSWLGLTPNNWIKCLPDHSPFKSPKFWANELGVLVVNDQDNTPIKFYSDLR